MPGKHHNVKKIQSYKNVFINLTASILELAHLLCFFLFNRISEGKVRTL